jgi:hypothetical protein
VTLLSERSAHAEVSLEELMHECLQLENYWAVKSTQDNTGGTPKRTGKRPLKMPSETGSQKAISSPARFFEAAE